MGSTRSVLFGFVAASLAFGPAASAQKATRSAPTAADWAAMAKLPDFNGVWEAGLGGGGGGGGRGAAGAGRGAAPAAAPTGAPPAGGPPAAAPGGAPAGRGGGRGGRGAAGG